VPSLVTAGRGPSQAGDPAFREGAAPGWGIISAPLRSARSGRIMIGQAA
jgi:hypothetical protein